MNMMTVKMIKMSTMSTMSSSIKIMMIIIVFGTITFFTACNSNLKSTLIIFGLNNPIDDDGVQ